MKDIIEKIGNSIIHHGKSSNRIYIMSLDKSDLPGILQTLDNLANKNGYTKIIVKIPVCEKEIFELNDYEIEAIIPDFFNGEKDGCFICKYLSKNRKTDILKDECNRILEIAKSKTNTKCLLDLDKGFSCRQAIKEDIPAMTDVYKKVFKTYPFPIHEKKFIEQTMDDNVIYFGIWHKDKLVALSSIELYDKYSNAEMTDFAVLKEYRGSGFAHYLLDIMEKKLVELGTKTAYTIARAKSAGMNITFSKNGYNFAGTLVNNTDISGHIESMNVWYKKMI